MKFRGLSLRWILLLVSFVAVSILLVNTYLFLQRYKEEERTKMNNWAIAQEAFLKSTNLNEDLGDLTVQVLSSNTTTPMILTDPDGNITNYRNIDSKITANPERLKEMANDFAKQNQPLEVRYNQELYAYLYYGDSDMIRYIKTFPFVILLVVLLFGTAVYLSYSSDKSAEQNLLWAGMAKETAHQIGTPLSSLVGWVEILKDQKVPPEMLTEIEKDLDRLRIITERFSKIGSKPSLVSKDLVEETRLAVGYIAERSSKLIKFDLKLPDAPVRVNLNTELFNWTLENLIKNGIDAMKGKGQITIKIAADDKTVTLLIGDTGSGIPKKIQRQIFKPGFTTKMRGWGLGLSLAKRIIEQYHQGKLSIKKTEPGKGTLMQIVLLRA